MMRTWRMLRVARSLLAGLVVGLFGITPVSAQSAPGGGAWMPGPGAAGDRNSLAGVIDAPPNGASVQAGTLALTGWFVDLTAQGWTGVDDVEVFLGTMDGGGRPLGHALLQQSRPDVAAALKNPYWAPAGWSATVSTLTLPHGSNTVSVYAHVPGRGWWLRQVSINIPSAPPPPRGAPAMAQPVPSPPSPTGNDLSFPECPTGAEPSPPAFGIVGINRGRPLSSNPCLARQSAWAAAKAGRAVYVNTGYPGTGDPVGYGRRLVDDAIAREHAAGVAGTTVWWLDVETVNTWEGTSQQNATVLDAMAARLQDLGVRVGIYSTPQMWLEIAGAWEPALPVWYATGPGTQATAAAACDRSFAGSDTAIVQWVQPGVGGPLDHNLICPAFADRAAELLDLG